MTSRTVRRIAYGVIAADVAALAVLARRGDARAAAVLGVLAVAGLSARVGWKEN